mmetsp:Transcript_23177/g.43858  ORF Transcript_23177/g.43858 Transcript_23177/m.43858 type:complete len:424 (-) Transcript_23177:391-1662(-)
MSREIIDTAVIMGKGNNPPNRTVFPRTFANGISVIKSSPPASNNEAYFFPIMPDIETKLSLCSSVCVETGAPDIRHLASESATFDEDDEQQQPQKQKQKQILLDVATSAYSAGEEDQGVITVPHLLSSPINDDGYGGGLDFDDDNNDAPSSPSLLSRVEVLQTTTDVDSIEAIEVISSITLSDFSMSRLIQPSMFDFSQSIMPELTPRRRRYHRTQHQREQQPWQPQWNPDTPSRRQHNRSNNSQLLSIVAPTPTRYMSKSICTSTQSKSRYRRPVDSLLLPQEQDNGSASSRETPSHVPENSQLNPLESLTRDVYIHIGSNSSNTPPMTKTLKSSNHSTSSKHHRRSVSYSSYTSCSQQNGCGSSVENNNPQSPRFRRHNRKGNVLAATVAEPKSRIPRTMAMTTHKNALKVRRDHHHHCLC